MATQPAFDKPISVEEYLVASFEYDCERVDGALVERNGGEFDHSLLMTLVGAHIQNHRAEWNVICLFGVRVRTGVARIRVPDLAILRAGAPRERILTHPPLLVIEIQSPEDNLRRTTAKAAEYLAFGIEHVWVIDPAARVAYCGTPSGLELARSGELTVPGTPIRIVLEELFSELDRA
jgi:Uma2 family endonuclease